jgi:hypothetical protein
MIFVDGEWEAFVEVPTNTYTYEGDGQEICVRIVYDGPAELPNNNYYYAMSCEECVGGIEPQPTCEPGAPLFAEVNNEFDQVHLFWGDQPEPPTPAQPFFDDFENGLGNWTLVSADDENWEEYDPSEGLSFNAHSGSMCASSWSWRYGESTDPDHYMISPMVNGATSVEYFVNTNASFPDHYAVLASTTGNDPSDFIIVMEEVAPGAKGGQNVAANDVNRGGTRGSWVARTVELPAGTQYVAFRHYNSYDCNYLLIDDVTINVERSAGNRDDIVSYNIYRSEDGVDYELIATVDGDVTEYFDTPEAGTYYYQVTALYADGCESAPAVSGIDPEVNYVMVGVTGIDENNINVALFPNPTKGNVTIQAKGMNHITVVSVLGQVVFDTELDQDEYIMNMAQFNTGLYMVRVYTNEGVTVKRVTVMH